MIDNEGSSCPYVNCCVDALICMYIYTYEAPKSQLKETFSLLHFDDKANQIYASQFVAQYHSNVGPALNMKDPISNNFYKLSNKICMTLLHIYCPVN